jgi:hypothetical protein
MRERADIDDLADHDVADYDVADPADNIDNGRRRSGIGEHDDHDSDDYDTDHDTDHGRPSRARRGEARAAPHRVTVGRERPVSPVDRGELTYDPST